MKRLPRLFAMLSLAMLPSSALAGQVQYGVELDFSAMHSDMGDWNDLGESGDARSIRMLDDLKQNDAVGITARMRGDNWILGAGYRRIGIEAETAFDGRALLIDLPTDVYQVTAGLLVGSRKGLSIGPVLGLGVYSFDGSMQSDTFGTLRTYQLSGSAFGAEAMLMAEIGIGGNLAITGGVGHTWAAIEDMEVNGTPTPDGFSTDLSGPFGRIGIAFYGN